LMLLYFLSKINIIKSKTFMDNRWLKKELF
jgi:hypothetical protein